MGACPVDVAEGSKERASVAFPHEMHMESYDCEVCHHKYDSNKNNILDIDSLEEGNPGIMCASCHDSNNKINTREAYHRLCIGCHDAKAQNNQALVPTLCNECHKPESMVSIEYDMIIKGQK